MLRRGSVVRYNFGTTEGEISGESVRKRRSAKHLEFLPSLLEGAQYKTLSAASGVAYVGTRRFISPLNWTEVGPNSWDGPL